MKNFLPILLILCNSILLVGCSTPSAPNFTLISNTANHVGAANALVEFKWENRIYVASEPAKDIGAAIGTAELMRNHKKYKAYKIKGVSTKKEIAIRWGGRTTMALYKGDFRN